MEAPSLPHPWPQAPTQGRKGVPLFCEPFPGAQAQIPCGHCSWAHLGHGARGPRAAADTGVPGLESTCLRALGPIHLGRLSCRLLRVNASQGCTGAHASAPCVPGLRRPGDER